MARRAASLGFAALLIATAPASALWVEDNQLVYVDGRYVTSFQARLNTEPDAVWRLLTDYNQLTRLSRVFHESRIVKIHGPDRHRVAVIQHACVWFFCKTMRKVAEVSRLPPRELLIVTDARESDFSYSVEAWRVEAAPEGGTRVYYHAAFTPAFFVPPLIGPWMVKSMFREELELTAGNLESLANPSPAPSR